MSSAARAAQSQSGYLNHRFLILMRCFFVLLLINLIISIPYACSMDAGGVAGKKTIAAEALLQGRMNYYPDTSNLEGNIGFNLPNVRFGLRGQLGQAFYYRTYFNLENGFDLKCAYLGYFYSDAFRIQAGLMKPVQSQDYFISTGSTDFIFRSRAGEMLVHSYEAGIAAEGDIGRFYYFSGFFSGNGNLPERKQHYLIGRLQYSVGSFLPGELTLGVQGSHGNSEGVTSGSTGPVIWGKRSIYGADFRLEGDRILLAGEYMSGLLDTDNVKVNPERINGFYLTSGYYILEKTMVLGRFQVWRQREAGLGGQRLTFGINQSLAGIFRFQLNYDIHDPDPGDTIHGFSALLQMKF